MHSNPLTQNNYITVYLQYMFINSINKRDLNVSKGTERDTVLILSN